MPPSTELKFRLIELAALWTFSRSGFDSALVWPFTVVRIVTTTWPSGIAGTWDVINLSSSVDYTGGGNEPHFGYNVQGAIGGTVYNDVDNDQTQDAGEPGLSGETVTPG